ncbi:tRNA glutamyl-Q(34) synthetase GluQRS [Lysobacter firmicutimachus]|uniref:Glutamyl-Q tRNA(Asp) synthetase n=1 Tax=Lysobacter firmicutimachus TaxID=1792846 RepID=A0ABU8D120_9GAMM|nr:tRNA glutamyl-Q(34) synthetase GluQRS [Lysobacter antibioticus]
MSGHPSFPPEHAGGPASPGAAAPAPYRGRFAPSPTGDLHPGSLLAAFGSWLLARHHRGAWLVRIEDLDPPREVPGAAERQLRALAAFGLESDEPVRRQSERGELYRAALDQLLARGLAFACRCSRSDLAAAGGIHRRCLAAAREPGRAAPQAAVRLRVADGATVGFDDAVLGPQRQDVAAEVGDFVLRRADGYWAYQLAVVVDDADQGITDVVRGADLLDSTARQILLQRALRLPTPRYAHLPLLLDAQGRKLSKSDAAQPLDPSDPLPALRAAWHALGQDPEPLAAVATVTQLLDQARVSFSPAQIPKCAETLAAVHNTPAPNAV